MMDWADVAGRITAGEGLTTEFKRTLEFRWLGRAVCGFANTSGGVVVLGVDDGDGIVGVAGDPESIRERLTNFLQNGCNAPLHGTCGSRELDAGWVHWVEVPRQRGFEPMRYDGRVWVRRDRITAEPSPTELQELYNAFGYVLTEEQAITAADPDDIDLKVFRGHLANQGLDLNDPQPTEEDDLQNLGVTTEFDGKACPTLFGLMAFGKQPQTFTNRQLLDRLCGLCRDRPRCGRDPCRRGDWSARRAGAIRARLVMRKAMREFNGAEPGLEEDALSRFVTVTLPLARP